MSKKCWHLVQSGNRDLAMPCTAPHIGIVSALCAGQRRRENGVAASPPGIARGALFCALFGCSATRRLASAGPSPTAHRPSPSVPSEPLRHLFENLALVAGQTLDAMLRELVEHTIELVGSRFSAPRRGRQRYGSLRRDGFAL